MVMPIPPEQRHFRFDVNSQSATDTRTHRIKPSAIALFPKKCDNIICFTSLERKGGERLLTINRRIIAAGMVLLSLCIAPDLLIAAERARTITIGGTGCALGGMKHIAHALQKEHPELTVKIIPSLGSGGGIKGVLAGSLDVALSARPLNGREQAQGASAIEYARTPFVFVSATASRRRAVTLEQAASIYGGDVHEWPDHTPIRLVMRPEADADTALLKAMSQAMEQAVRKALSRDGMLVAVTDQENADMLAKVTGAFGAASLTQIVAEKRPLRALSLDGVVPSLKTLAQGAYPYYKVFYAVTGPHPSPDARLLLDFLISPEGRTILTKTGHLVPQRAQ